MKKRLTSFLLVLALSFSLSVPAFAADDNQYYSFPSVGSGVPSVAMDWPVNPAVEHDYTSQLSNIQINQQTQTNILQSMQSALQAVNVWLGKIETNTSKIKDYSSILSTISSTLSRVATEQTLSAISVKIATEKTLADFASYFADVFSVDYIASGTSVYGARYKFKNANGSDVFVSLPYLMWYLQTFLTYDADMSTNRPTIYKMLHLLQTTLASEDDRELAENYKENREQAESDFLSGKSGKTSLGKGDFSNASQVGGALNDTFNMGGASKVSDFLSGFGSAGTESQAWFSQTTANNLNAVEASDGTQGVSTFSDDGETMVDVDPDPYNMANIFDRYDWLEGVNMDD